MPQRARWGIVAVAFWAHVGGFAAGVVAGVLFGRIGFPVRSYSRIDLRGRRSSDE